MGALGSLLPRIMPTGYGYDERRVYEDGMWQCKTEAKAFGNVC
jgi:hypothetical protein